MITKITGLKVNKNIGKFDIADKARIMYAGDYIFDIIAYDTDTDAVYSFGFNYTDEVLYSIEYIDGDYIEGMMSPVQALTTLKEMSDSQLFEFELRESDLVEREVCRYDEYSRA